MHKREVCDNSIYAREVYFIYTNSGQQLTQELRTIRRFVLGAQSVAELRTFALPGSLRAPRKPWLSEALRKRHELLE
jgi:hypothetical protein